MPKYTDEALEYWGDVFVESEIKRRCELPELTFEQFMLRPEFYIRLAEYGDLAASERLARSGLHALSIEAEIDDLPRHDGAPVEKMTHTRWPKSQCDFSRKQKEDAS